MRKVLGALAVTALAASMTPAVAADIRIPVKAPVMAPVAVYNWTGFYVGGNAGYSWGRGETDLAGTLSTTTNTSVFRTASGPGAAGAVTTTGPLVVSSPATGTSRIDGAIAGAQMGYNWQIDRTWVFGLETDIQWSGEKGRLDLCFTVGCTVGNSYDHHLRWFGTLRARGGVLIDPRVLLYVTGGLAYGEVASDSFATLLGVTGFGNSKSIRAGWTVGGGIEGALDNNWSIKAEYLYADYGRFSNAGGALTASNTVILPDTPTTAFSTIVNTVVTASGTSTTRLTDQVFRVGINYRFAPAAVVARY